MEDYIRLKTKLQLCKNSNINLVEDKDVDKIEDVKINTNLPKIDRVMNFLKEVKNPYMFIVDGVKVKFEYSENGMGINECLENLIMNRAKI